MRGARLAVPGGNASGAEIPRGLVERFFRRIEEKLALRVRPFIVPNEQPKRALPFKTDQLARSLVKSGVPTEEVFEIIEQVASALHEGGFFQAEIETRDLVRAVGGVLRIQDHPSRQSWVDAYHNRYGWALEQLASPSEAEHYVRTTDFPRLDAIVDAFLEQKLSVRTPQAVDGTSWPEMDRHRLRRQVTRCVRASLLHSVSVDFVEAAAREIAHWNLNAPDWNDEQRKEQFSQAKEVLRRASEALSIGYSLDAEEDLRRAVMLLTRVFQQRFALWVGLPDENPATMLERLVTLLRVAQGAMEEPNWQRQESTAELFERLSRLKITPEDLALTLLRLASVLRAGAAERGVATGRGADSASRQIERLRDVLRYVERFLGWAGDLIWSPQAWPTVQDYYRATRFAERQRILDSIVEHIVNGAGLRTIKRGAHSITVEIPPECVVLRGFGNTPEMTFICIAAERAKAAVQEDEGASFNSLEKRLDALGTHSQAVILVSPHGFSRDVRAELLATRRWPLVLTLSSEALRAMTLPSEVSRLLENAAREVLENRPFPKRTPMSVVQTFQRARGLAANLLFKEALHNIVVEFEGYLRASMRGWLIALWGAGGFARATQLLGRPVRFDRLDVGTCLALCRNRDFVDACAAFVGTSLHAQVERAQLFPAELLSLMVALGAVRNKSAHGAKRLFDDDYERARTLFEQFVRLALRLDYWPRLLKCAVPRRDDRALIIDPDDLNSALEVRSTLIPFQADDVYVFARGWAIDAPEALCCVTSSRICAECGASADVEDWEMKLRCPRCEKGQVSASPVTQPLTTDEEPVQFCNWLDWLDQHCSDSIDAVLDQMAALGGRGAHPSKRPRSRWKKILNHARKRGLVGNLFSVVIAVRADLQLPAGFPRVATAVPPLPASPPSLPSRRVPRVLVDALRAGKLTLFVGSGLSLGDDVGGNFPSWGDLPERLIDALCEHDDSVDGNELRARFKRSMALEVRLAELSTLRTLLGRHYQRVLNDIFRPPEAAPGAAHRAVASLRTKAIITTNYDQLVELADKKRQPYTWKQSVNALGDLQNGRPIVFKAHGSAEDHESVVLSEVEYQRARADAGYRSVFERLLQDQTWLFVGYGMNDPLDLDLALRGNASTLRSAARQHYVLLKGASSAEQDRLARDYNVRTITYAEHVDVTAFLDDLAARSG